MIHSTSALLYSGLNLRIFYCLFARVSTVDDKRHQGQDGRTEPQVGTSRGSRCIGDRDVAVEAREERGDAPRAVVRGAAPRGIWRACVYMAGR